MHSFRLLSFLAVLCGLLAVPAQGQQTEIQYLSGKDKDHTVDWEFMVTGGRRSGSWTTIPTPSNWELQGFGTYSYGHANPRSDEEGKYRYRFDVPASWRGKNIQIVFEGSMTDTGVRVNGKPAGPVHQGGFTQFRYDITNLVQPGRKNLLEVTVSKESANDSVNEAERQADFWTFGGIYRPVYLEARPSESIQRIALDAKADGSFLVYVFLNGARSADAVRGQIRSLDGSPVGEVFTSPVQPGDERVTLRTQVINPKTWTPEFPNRYRVSLDLVDGSRTVHSVSNTFGFRTVELRPRDGVYVNGVKVHLKGVNRHSFWPDAGRASSREVSELDVNLIKDMNMNAVRMSHYPPDQHFLYVADSLGLFVMDELTGWQDAYDTEVGSKLVRELVTRDVNHPSVIFWDNGNEGGFNYDLVDDYHLYDPQKRPVIHPWQNQEGYINTTHYRDYNCCAGEFFEGRDVFLPTEFLHGLYDGGMGAGLQDMWNRMVTNPLSAGAMLWVFADEGVVRTDQDGRIDTDGNHAPDGVVGPYREKEGSFNAIKETWSPVFIDQRFLAPSFDGRLPVENRYYYTSLDRISFAWRLVDFPGPSDPATGHSVAANGTVQAPDVAPWRRGELRLDLPADWRTHDALYLTATDPHGREIYTWTWMIPTPAEVREDVVRTSGAAAQADESDGAIVLTSGNTRVSVSKTTGRLTRIEAGGKALPLTDGPRIIDGSATLRDIRLVTDEGAQVVEANYEGNLKRVRWTLLPGGWLKLEYAYENPGKKPYLGVTFDLPEGEVEGMKWLGKGPYRVWKNRMQGQTFDVWQKAYNDTRTGASWEYPEFKGNHAELYWAVLNTRPGDITIVSDTEDLFLRVLTPGFGEEPRYTAVAFPEGDLSFLHGIAPIGTKFHPAEDHGPQGQPNEAVGLRRTQDMGLYEATLYFQFNPDR